MPASNSLLIKITSCMLQVCCTFCSSCILHDCSCASKVSCVICLDLITAFCRTGVIKGGKQEDGKEHTILGHKSTRTAAAAAADDDDDDW